MVRAARFLYLNKTSFNGLWRVNSKDQHNAPFNNKEQIRLYDREQILEISRKLKTWNISSTDFEKVILKAKKNDFVFIDPPYDVSDDLTFSQYHVLIFGNTGQTRLATILKELDKRKVRWMLTNHKNGLINELYKDYQIDEVVVNRMINSDATKRSKSQTELIITNQKQVNW